MEERMNNLEVVGARVLVKEFKAEETTKSGILIANTTAQQPTLTGKVLLTGKGAYLENGSIRPMAVKEGDTVMWAKFSGTPIKYEKEEYLMLNERDILLIIHE